MTGLSLLMAAAMASASADLSGQWLIMHRGGHTIARRIRLDRDARSLTVITHRGATNRLPLASVVAFMKRADEKEANMPTGSGPYFAELLSGERIRTESFTLGDEGLSVRHFYYPDLSWPRRKVKRLVRADDRLPSEPSGFQGLRFSNGDATRGKILSIGDGVAMVDMPGIGKIPVDNLEAVQAFVFVSRIAGRRKFYFTDDLHVEILCKNREVLAGTLVGTGPGAWRLQTAWHEKPLSVPVTFIRSVAVHGTAVHLADLTPAEDTLSPYLGFILPWREDRSLRDTVLRVGPFAAHRGLALHSRTRLEYRIEHLAKRPVSFLCLMGLDAGVAGLNGSVAVTLAVDGKPRLVKQVEDAAVPRLVHLKIPAGSRTLTVTADFAERGSVADHLDLLYAGFVAD